MSVATLNDRASAGVFPRQPPRPPTPRPVPQVIPSVVVAQEPESSQMELSRPATPLPSTGTTFQW
jgi:hypothetical protein